MTLSAREDTEKEALKLLQQLSNYDVSGARGRPDPVVENAWLVTLKDGTQVIVYLNGLGNSGLPDFEEVD